LNLRTLRIIKLSTATVAVVGVLLIALSPLIGEPISGNRLWWIEPIAYIGAAVAIAFSATTIVIMRFENKRHFVTSDDRTWSQVTQDYFDTFAHDMGRPLRRILGKEREVRALVSETGDAPLKVVNELLNEIEQQAPNFRLMIENVRVLVDLEDADARPAVEPVDVAAIVRNVADRYVPIARERGIELVWWCEPVDFGLVYGDGSALDHIITNLVDNATKYAEEHVEIRLERDGSLFTVIVWDDGVGISESHLPHLFDRGWTPELSARAEKQSSGLGLFIASTLARRCGGELNVDSTSHGNGASIEDSHTAFLLSLPLDNRANA